MVRRLPAEPGVYRFRDARGRVLYVVQYDPTRERSSVAQVSSIEAVACASVHEAAWLERNLLQNAMPRWNRTPGGQENQVYIRLGHPRAGRAPKTSRPLAVVYEASPAHDVKYFGPYLGGVRTRQAVSALYRIRPGANPAARGAHQELIQARARGHAPAADLDDLAAILAKDPAAVARAQTELTVIRDRAAQNLAFEFAAKVQAEAEALAWVTGPQRVTSMDPGDLDVYGWAAGTLVHFGVRGGRLCHWSQRACPDQATAAGPLAATPPGWAEFAVRNAELAAQLAG